jgi:hypothetical protein
MTTRRRKLSQSEAEKHRANQARFRTKNWQYRLWCSIRYREKKFNIEVTIDRNYLDSLWEQQKGRCFWTKVPIYTDCTPKHPQRISIDRVDSTKGYIQGNVVLCCRFANFGKSDADLKTWLIFLETMRQHFNPIPVSSDTPVSTESTSQSQHSSPHPPHSTHD